MQPTAQPKLWPLAERIRPGFTGESAVGPVVPPVAGTVPSEGGATPLERGGRSPLACLAGVLLRARCRTSSDTRCGRQHVSKSFTFVLSRGHRSRSHCVRARARLAPQVESPGVLGRVKVPLAPLAADATLTRPPRALVGRHLLEPAGGQRSAWIFQVHKAS